MTPGFTGADLANLCNEAVLIAARNDQTMVDMEHLEAAVDRIMCGLAKKTIVSIICLS